MFINPTDLASDFQRLEEIEKATLRLVSQAIFSFRDEAVDIFENERDKVQDIGEDITREALDKMGVSKNAERLFGKIDYKRARYIFHPDYALRQALFVDSKAEKNSGRDTATIQTAQTSMIIRHVRSGQDMHVPGSLPTVWEVHNKKFLTTTIFVKYNYDEDAGKNTLTDITTAALPSGMLQEIYNPSPVETIWRAGRNAPSLGEAFRVRLVFRLLKQKKNWRVQTLPIKGAFHWDD
jgi:hypothetical protein